MQLGDHSNDRTERSRVGVALDKLNADFSELLDVVESGGLDQLGVAEKVAWWQRFESFRNRLPLLDHQMITDAEATDLAGNYSFSSLARLLTRICSFPQARQRLGSGPPQLLGLAPRCLENGWSRCYRGWLRCSVKAPYRRRKCKLWSGLCKSSLVLD